ncbi:MAG TPA: glutamate 5-kinase [Gaiellaceae bacterium]|nr:glutamate 5-kinase [Gaiellaceae bacterium]
MTVVVKLGSSLVTDGAGRIRRSVLTQRAADVAALGEPVCVVSSGAIALGLPVLGLGSRPRATPQLQAASAAGQVRLQLAWESAFRRHGLRVAQVLLSAGDLAERASYLNVRNALNALLKMGVVPVVNENDATATDEITFGDNDALAAQVAVLLGARLLVLLTEVEGVYGASAELVTSGDAIDEAALGMGSALGRGGMASKVAAARVAAEAGIPTVIASGRGDGVVRAIAAGEARGTAFAPASTTANAFKLWLRHAKPTAGRLVVDDGAREAILTGGKSLLAVGVVSCDGSFEEGDAVEIVATDGSSIGKGIAGASADELRSRPRGVEAVHRDRLVIVQA